MKLNYDMDGTDKLFGLSVLYMDVFGKSRMRWIIADTFRPAA